MKAVCYTTVTTDIQRTWVIRWFLEAKEPLIEVVAVPRGGPPRGCNEVNPPNEGRERRLRVPGVPHVVIEDRSDLGEIGFHLNHFHLNHYGNHYGREREVVNISMRRACAMIP